MDILLVTFLVYRILIVVRGTRAYQMIMGVVALIGLFWVGVTLKLPSLNWILSRFFDSFFIIAVVLFQEPFRNSLASFATTRKNLGGWGKNKFRVEIEEVVEAVFRLGKKSRGALIVLEKNDGLSNYISTGTSLDAQIHSDLIVALFESHSSLHDGAMVIGKKKILAAGCFLPLSKDLEIKKEFGSRHRAALGLTQVTDSVVITVSEERGIINLFFKGKYHPCPSEKILRNYLFSLWSNKVWNDKNIIPGDFEQMGDLALNEN